LKNPAAENNEKSPAHSFIGGIYVHVVLFLSGEGGTGSA
jgi:hypothetical protein